jgi:hypothetical protein
MTLGRVPHPCAFQGCGFRSHFNQNPNEGDATWSAGALLPLLHQTKPNLQTLSGSPAAAGSQPGAPPSFYEGGSWVLSFRPSKESASPLRSWLCTRRYKTAARISAPAANPHLDWQRRHPCRLPAEAPPFCYALLYSWIIFHVVADLQTRDLDSTSTRLKTTCEPAKSRRTNRVPHPRFVRVGLGFCHSNRSRSRLTTPPPYGFPRCSSNQFNVYTAFAN